MSNNEQIIEGLLDAISFRKRCIDDLLLKLNEAEEFTSDQRMEIQRLHESEDNLSKMVSEDWRARTKVAEATLEKIAGFSIDETGCVASQTGEVKSFRRAVELAQEYLVSRNDLK